MPPSDTRARFAVAAAAGLAAVVVAVGLAIALFGGEPRSAETKPPAGFIVAALENATPAEEPFAGLTEVQLAVGGSCLRLVAADVVDERVQGLRGRSDLGPYDGMLFVFDEPTASSFTMRGVPVPLDIGWYDARGFLIERTAMEPCPDDLEDCPAYSPGSRYRFALETLGDELPGGALGSCSAWRRS
ncbi:MAG TPA: DUF192 domain-containing protein [Acidimicrobiia bacterium]